MEPRTTTDFIRDLLSTLREREWIETYTRCGRGCCGEWSTQCPDCGECEEKGHSEDCQTKRLISETEGYLMVEDELEREVA